MHRVEAVRVAEEIVRRFRGAADAGNLGDPMRFDRKLETGLDDRGRDRVVAAAGAQCRDLALVVAMSEAELVLLQRGMMELRLCDVGHESTMCPSLVMAGLKREARLRADVPAIHVLAEKKKD